MNAERRIVDNRVFLLGLDKLYRKAMKRHESDELLKCAQVMAAKLNVAPAEVPVEGYYSEDLKLTEYFRLVRALQNVDNSREPELRSVIGFSRLKEVTQSPIFGIPRQSRSLLPGAVDPLTTALESSFPNWTVENLTNATYEVAMDTDDFSLVGLAALAKDSVVLAALRETVVLYAAIAAGSAMMAEPIYDWTVDDEIAERARRFVEAFNSLFHESLPTPEPSNAADFWNAHDPWSIVGRCVRVGFDDRQSPVQFYHWAIDHDSKFRLCVKGFWNADIWTTERYRQKLESETFRK
jgi:hypothetical protein